MQLAGEPEFQVFLSVDDFSLDDVAPILPQRIHLRKSYWRNLELSPNSSFQLYYVLIRLSGKIVGFCCFQRVHFDGGQLLHYLPEDKPGFWNQLRRKTSKLLALPVLPLIQVDLLVSGNVFMTGDSGFYFSPDIRMKKRADWFNRAVTKVAEQDKRIRAVLIPDMYSPKTEWDDCLEQQGYYPIYEEADMVLSLQDEWKVFDDYTSAMSSKYRVRTKKVYQLSAALECREMTLADLQQHQPEMLQLYAQVIKNARFKLAELPVDFFLKQKEILPDDYMVTGYFHQGKLLGFLSAYIQPEQIDVHYTGMHYPDSYAFHLYQRMLYDMIEQGIRRRKKRLHFGRTAPEIKSTVGAVPLDTYGYVRHFSPFINHLIVAFFSRRLKPVYYNYRSPFR